MSIPTFQIGFIMGLTTLFIGCQESTADESVMPQEKVVVVERKDTVVTFDPATNQESIQIVTSYDTIVSFDE